MRFSLFLLLGVCVNLAQANWTGVELSLSNTDSDWDFDGDTRESQVDQISLQIEEKTNSGTRIGATFGHLSLRLVADNPSDTRKFDAQFLGVYLRQPVALTDSIELHGQLNLRYATGRENDSDDDDRADIDWSEIDLQFGLGWRFAQFRIMPFVTYSDIDGDIDDDLGTRIFELDDPVSRGVALDYFVDKTAFLRLEIYQGNRSGGYLTFARRY